MIGELSATAVSKAVGKGARAVDEIGNIANKADDVADIAETAGKIDDIAEIAETAGKADDIGDFYDDIYRGCYDEPFNPIEEGAILDPDDVADIAEKAAKQLGYKPGTKKYYEFCKKYVDPRNIPQSVIENAISSTKPVAGKTAGTFVHETADVKVIVNSAGKVVTVIPK